MNTLARSNITILHDTQEWSTDLDGDITEVKIDGRRLSDIHDLTVKIDKITIVTKALAITATCLAVIAVTGIVGIGSWLITHHESINQKLSTKISEQEAISLRNQRITMENKLKSIGWEWKDGGWQQIGNTTRRRSN